MLNIEQCLLRRVFGVSLALGETYHSNLNSIIL
jgi:hypothetical protein